MQNSKPDTYEKSFGDPSHMGGVKINAISINQKQKLMFGKKLLSSSWKSWDDKMRYTVPAPNNVNWMQMDTRTLKK